MHVPQHSLDADPANPENSPKKRARKKKKGKTRAERFEAVRKLLKSLGTVKTQSGGVSKKTTTGDASAAASAVGDASAAASAVGDASAATSAVGGASAAASAVGDASSVVRGSAKKNAPLFKSADVIALAKSANVRALQEIARDAFERLKKMPPPHAEDGWGPLMPTWGSKGHARGLLGWGETRATVTEDGKEKRVVRQKKGALHQICRAPAMKALKVYFEWVGVPPVIAGETLKKAIQDGRFKADYVPARQSSNTRGQVTLVPLPAKAAQNYAEQFSLVLAAVLGPNPNHQP
jgi:hypothetical protein